MSTRANFKATRNGCGCAGVVWLVVLSIIEVPFEALHNTFGAIVGVIVGIAWTVVAIKWMGKYGSASYYEKAM